MVAAENIRSKVAKRRVVCCAEDVLSSTEQDLCCWLDDEQEELRDALDGRHGVRRHNHWNDLKRTSQVGKCRTWSHEKRGPTRVASCSEDERLLAQMEDDPVPATLGALARVGVSECTDLASAVEASPQAQAQVDVSSRPSRRLVLARLEVFPVAESHMLHQSAEFSAGTTLLDFTPDEAVSTVLGHLQRVRSSVVVLMLVPPWRVPNRFQRTLKFCQHVPLDALCSHAQCVAAEGPQRMLHDGPYAAVPTQWDSDTETQDSRRSIVDALEFDLTRGDSDEEVGPRK